MKKVLFATTALIATAGMAAADVSMSGYARWGLKYDEGAAEETTITSRYRINLDAKTETDAGVKLAARIRMQANASNANGTANTGAFNGARFQMAYEGLTVEVGNVSGVFDAAAVMDFYGNEPGLTGLTGQYSTWGGPKIDYSSGGAGVNGVNAKYEMNGFTVMAAFTPNNPTGAGAEDQWELGFGYEINDWKVGVAFGSQEQFGAADVDYWAAVASGSLGPADVSIFVGDDDVNNETSYGISAAFDAGAATTVIASIAAGGAADAPGGHEVFGIGFKHSLGGGATLRGGIGQNVSGNTIADFGVRFDF